MEQKGTGFGGAGMFYWTSNVARPSSESLGCRRLCLGLPSTRPADAASAEPQGAVFECVEKELLGIIHFLFTERETLSLKPFLAIRGDRKHLAGSFLKNRLRLQARSTEAITSYGPGSPSHLTAKRSSDSSERLSNFTSRLAFLRRWREVSN